MKPGRLPAEAKPFLRWYLGPLFREMSKGHHDTSHSNYNKNHDTTIPMKMTGILLVRRIMIITAPSEVQARGLSRGPF